MKVFAAILVCILLSSCSSVAYIHEPYAGFPHQVRVKASKMENLVGKEPGTLPEASISGAAWYTHDGEYYIIGLDFEQIEKTANGQSE